MPRAPKSPSYLWNESGPALPNDEEKLFLAFLVVGNSWSVEEQLIWASAALGEELNVTRLGSAWKPPDSNGWRAPSKVVPAPLFAPLFAAYKRPWEAPEMERIAVAMEQWPLAGRIVGLNRHHLTAHKKRNHGKGPFGPALPGKTPGPRWKTGAAVCGVAALVQRHGADLRLALRLADGEQRQTPTQQVDAANEHVERLDSRLGEVAAERDEAKAERDKARDTLRKSTARSMEYRKAAAAVRDKEREKEAKARKAASKKETDRRQQLVNDRLAAALQRRAARLQEPDLVQARKVAKARKRARCVEEQAKLSQKRLRRAQSAEADLRSAQS
jgi:hypothetical protein